MRHFFIDKITTVIGDGELALRAAGELATVAQRVNLVGPTEGALETPLGKKLVEESKVMLYEGYEAVEVLGSEFAETIVARSPSGERTEIPADGTFIEMGLLPNSQMVADFIQLDDQDRIEIDCATNTNIPGVFAAGDVTTIYAEQVLIAVGEGAKAALSAYEYLLPTL